MRDEFYPRPSNFFKLIVHISFKILQHHLIKIMHSIYRLASLASQVWQMESILSAISLLLPSIASSSLVVLEMFSDSQACHVNIFQKKRKKNMLLSMLWSMASFVCLQNPGRNWASLFCLLSWVSAEYLF